MFGKFFKNFPWKTALLIVLLAAGVYIVFQTGSTLKNLLSFGGKLSPSNILTAAKEAVRKSFDGIKRLAFVLFNPFAMWSTLWNYAKYLYKWLVKGEDRIVAYMDFFNWYRNSGYDIITNESGKKQQQGNSGSDFSYDL